MPAKYPDIKTKVPRIIKVNLLVKKLLYPGKAFVKLNRCQKPTMYSMLKPLRQSMPMILFFGKLFILYPL